MARPLRLLRLEDFKDVKIKSKSPMDFLAVIAEFEIRRLNGIEKEGKKEKAERLAREKKLKKPMPINGDNCSKFEEVIINDNNVKKINFPRSGSKRKKISGDPESPGGCEGGQIELPEIFQASIMSIGGSDCRLVLEKKLFSSDVNKNQSRFSLPPGKTRPGSLEPEELKRAELGDGTAVSFIQPSGDILKGGLIFKRWKLNGCTSTYVLRGWAKVAESNRLKKNDRVQLWSFRVGSELGFALVNFGREKKEGKEEEEEAA